MIPIQYEHEDDNLSLLCDLPRGYKMVSVNVNHRDSLNCYAKMFPLCLYLASIPGRLKIRPGVYCMGDSAHALVMPPETGESPSSFSI